MKPRKNHKGLPNRVYVHHGSYWYRPIEPVRIDGTLKKAVKLCRFEDGESAMHHALAVIKGDKSLDKNSVAFVCAEYKANRLKKYTKTTQDQYTGYLDKMAYAFADYLFMEPTTKDCADFLHTYFANSPNAAQKVAGLMGRVFKYGISVLGLRQDNPMAQIDVSDYEIKRRTVLPTHAQVKAIRKAGMSSKERSDTGKTIPTPSGPIFACIVDMAYLCWQRAIDVRMIRDAHIVDGRIRFAPTKTSKSSGKAVDIVITPAIQDVIDRAREIKRKNDLISPYLFPVSQGDNKGKPYTKSGLFSMWNRARDRIGIGKDSPPAERIQFRDLRALGATDAARAGEGKEELRKRLAHTTSKTSEIYIKESIPETSGIVTRLPW